MRYGGGGPFPIFVLLIFFLLVGIFGGGKGDYTLKNRIKDHLRSSLTYYCPHCHEKKVFIKHYGLITLILILMTKGTWLYRFIERDALWANYQKQKRFLEDQEIFNHYAISKMDC